MFPAEEKLAAASALKILLNVLLHGVSTINKQHTTEAKSQLTSQMLKMPQAIFRQSRSHLARRKGLKLGCCCIESPGLRKVGCLRTIAAC